MAGTHLKRFLKSIYPFISFLRSLRFTFRFPPSRLTLIAVFSGIFISFISFYDFVLKELPSPSSLTTTPVALTTHIRDRNGVELYKIYRSQNRTLVKLTDL